MMLPHWNQNYAEIVIGLHGKGMIHVVCPTIPNETLCKNQRIKVEEGDVFVVPRYHPMSQISYNNESFVFVGFTMTTKKNQPRYLAGKSSILQILDKAVLGKSFNARSTIIDQVYSAQRESFIFECTSCAEEEERLMEEEEAGRRREGGGGAGRQEKGREGEIARKEEEEMDRRQREAEEAAARGRGAAEKGGRGGGSYGEESW